MSVKKKPAGPSLDQQVKDYFHSRKENGVIGLRLLVQAIERTAKYRDWDALSRFIAMAHDSSSRPKVVKIVRAAFGTALTWKANTKHDTGGTVVMGWEGAFPLAQRNLWGVVKSAAEKGASWDDRAFLKELPGPDPKIRQASPEAMAKAAKHLAKYVLERESEGFSPGELLSLMEQEIKAARAQKSAPVAPVTKRVVNGAEVIDIPH